MSSAKRKTGSASELSTKKQKKNGGSIERESKLLGNMIQHLMQGIDGISFRTSASDLDFMERTKTWRDSWISIIDQELIEPCESGCPVYTGDHKLTEKGKTQAKTPEYEEYLKDLTFVAATNEQHQDRIKKKLKHKHGSTIIDLLLQHGALTRKELAGMMGTNDRSHGFSYALQELSNKKVIEKDGKKNKLSDKAFLPDKRPEPIQSDQEEIKQLIEKMSSSKNTRKAKGTEDGKEGKAQQKKKGSKQVVIKKDDEAEEKFIPDTVESSGESSDTTGPNGEASIVPEKVGS